MTVQQYLNCVQETIKTNPHLHARQVKVVAQNGKVQLSGNVHSFFEKQMAQEAVRRFDALAQIENALDVCKE